MNNVRYTIIIIFLFLFFHSSTANEQWEVYKTFQSYSQIEEYQGLLYIRSGNAIFFYNPETQKIGSFTQLDGLYSSPIIHLSKNIDTDKLVVVHEDGVIDLLDASGSVSSIFDFKNKSIIGDKTINHITECGKSIFLACGFGFIEIDLAHEVISDYYQTPQDCSFAFRYENALYYALSGGGLWKCKDQEKNSGNPNWQKIEDKEIVAAIVFNRDNEENCWILDNEKDIHILNPDGSYKKTSTRKCYEGLRISGNYIFSDGWGVDIIKADTQETSFIREQPYRACMDFYTVNDTTLFAVHPEKGLLKLSLDFNHWDLANLSVLEESCDYYEVAGNQINEMVYAHGILAGVSGYKMYTRGYTDMFLSSANVNFYEDEKWSHVSEEDVLSQPLATKEFRGLTNIAADPFIPHRFYVSTLTTGIYQFDDEELTKHLLTEERITALTCDQEGILWAAKPHNENTLWAYDANDDKWISHAITGHSNQKNIGRLIQQENESHHLIWSLNNYSYRKSQIGILYNPNGALDNSKDQSAIISTLKDQDNILYSFSSSINYVYDIQEDKEGKIWLLTNIGPFVIEDVVKAFNQAQKEPGIGLVKRIKIPRNDGTNLADYLLANILCTAMVTDQYNRKWIGTLGNGIYLLSADGQKELKHFTTENSPLQSNDITTLAYDQEGKRLFIACDGGVIIYHTEEIEPQADFSSFYCYPNPVRQDYSGDIVISGLMENTEVSVTTASGKLIWNSHSNDGSIHWDGRNENGERVAPGVYMIHAISKQSSKGDIFKLLVL